MIKAIRRMAISVTNAAIRRMALIMAQD